jgi:predicted permease
LSLLLLIGAGLFVRTLRNLQRVDPGFNTKNLLMFKVAPGLAGYKDERLIQLYTRLSERLEALPGVSRVTFSRTPLLADNDIDRSIYLRSALGTTPDADGRIRPTGDSYILFARENFLEAMQIPLLAGRTLNEKDDERAAKVVVVNQIFANQFFPNVNPIGKRFTFEPKKPDEIEIVGLVKDAKYTSQRKNAPPTIYLPWRQAASVMPEANYELRTEGDPRSLIDAVRQAMREVDESLPLRSFKTQIEQADETLRMERLFAKLVTLFGLLAQQLAAIGLFGVLAYSVSQRTHEIGIRMAVGASPADVMKMVMRQGMTLAVIGVVLGLGAAYVLTKYLESWLQLSKMLFGIKSTDPIVYGAMAVFLTFVAFVACCIPARRATKVDPIIALRCE